MLKCPVGLRTQACCFVSCCGLLLRLSCSRAAALHSLLLRALAAHPKSSSPAKMEQEGEPDKLVPIECMPALDRLWRCASASRCPHALSCHRNSDGLARAAPTNQFNEVYRHGKFETCGKSVSELFTCFHAKFVVSREPERAQVRARRVPFHPPCVAKSQASLPTENDGWRDPREPQGRHERTAMGAESPGFVGLGRLSTGFMRTSDPSKIQNSY